LPQLQVLPQQIRGNEQKLGDTPVRSLDTIVWSKDHFPASVSQPGPLPFTLPTKRYFSKMSITKETITKGRRHHECGVYGIGMQSVD